MCHIELLDLAPLAESPAWKKIGLEMIVFIFFPFALPTYFSSQILLDDRNELHRIHQVGFNSNWLNAAFKNIRNFISNNLWFVLKLAKFAKLLFPQEVLSRAFESVWTAATLITIFIIIKPPPPPGSFKVNSFRGGLSAYYWILGIKPQRPFSLCYPCIFLWPV